MHIACVLGEKLADRRVALGDPWTLVEQGCHLVEGRHVDLDQVGAEMLQSLDAGAPGGLGSGVAEEFLVGGARNADHRVRRRRSKGLK
jgi:hypothetical protein